MQQTVQCTGKARARRGAWASCLRWLAAACLALGAMGPAWASCPAVVNLNVTAGGHIALDCPTDGSGVNWGFLEIDGYVIGQPISSYPTPHGHADADNPSDVYAVTYYNTSGAGQTDTFTLHDGGTNAAVQFNIHIGGGSVPGAPTIGTATAGDTQASVSFTAPASDGGSPIAGYTVTSSPGGITASGAASPITVTGLTNGTGYTFTVTATNSAGSSPPSAASNSVTPKGSQTITFGNPGTQNFGTAPILTATATSGLTPTFTSTTTGVCTVTSAGVLTFVAAGTCSIDADQAGNGAFLAAPTVTQSFNVAAIAPGAPTIGTATAGDTQATVSFTAPASNGGAAITGYTVTSSPGGITASGSASPITVTGLTNGTAYTFTVTATNTADTGSPSAASNSVTPKGAQAITGFSASPSAPVFTTGGTFTVSATASSGLPVVFAIASASSSVCTIAGSTVTMLSAGTCSVTADQAGNAAFLPAPQQTLAVVISAPLVPVANPVSASVAYGSSANPIALNITGGTASSVAVGSAAAHGTATASGTSITYTPSAGFAGSDSFTYTATNASGTSAPATVSITVGAPTLALAPASGMLSLAYGTAYSQTFTASGGGTPYSYTLSGTLPTGVSFNSTTGVLSGTPVQSGNFPITVTATDSSTGAAAPFSITQNYTLQVAAATITLTPTSLPAGSAGSAYPATSLSASGGAGPYSYVVTSGSLPPGMMVAAAGQISGTPTAAGNFPFTVTATDANSQTGSQAYTLDIGAPTLSLDPASLPNATAETAYAQTISASGGTAPYSYAVSSGSLPAGISFDASTGKLSGTTTVSGDFAFTVEATDSSTGTGAPFSATRSYTLHVDAPSISVTPATLPNGNVGMAYPSTTLTASGGVGPYSVVLTGALPAGMTYDTGSATLSGTPHAAGNFTVDVTATDAHGFTGTRSYTFAIQAATLSLDPASLPDATAETAYAQTISASGGTAPYSYAVSSGNLPAGITLDAGTGKLAGTPTASGDFSFVIKVTDSSTGTGAPFTATQNYNLHVAAPALTLAPSSLPGGMAGTAYASTTLTASGGVGPYSIVLTGTLPAGMTYDAGTATLSGTPIAAGSFTLGATATDAHGFTATANYTLAIQAATLSLNPASLPNAIAEIAYAQTISASGGTAPYSYAVSSGNLPAGITFDAGTGKLAGTPTTSGDFSFTIKASDSSTGAGAPFSATRDYTLHVNAPSISVAPATLPTATAGMAYPSTTLSAIGGVAPYSYAVTAGTLPSGLNLSTSGTLSGTPTETGSFALTLTATDAHGFTGSASYTLTVASATLSVAPGSLPGATAESAYSQTLTTSGGVAPYSYAIASGALPAGLSLDAGTGTIAGTPTVSGSFSVGIKVTDASTGSGAPASITKNYTLAVSAPAIAITPASLPAAQQAEAYSQALGASGGNGSYSYTVTVGALPDGLNLSANGALSGTPTVSGSFGFTVTATDGLGFTGTQAYTLAVGVAKPVAKDDTASTSANQAATIAVTGNDSGPIGSIAVATAPVHGTATVHGLDVVYTPASNFFGTDKLTYTATGPGGTSAPATVTITVAPLAVPTAVAQTATTLAGAAVTIHATQGASGGPFTAVTLASTPASGTAAVSGNDIVYTPAIDASGSVSFTYTLSNPFGVSQAATITVQVHPVPQVVAQTVDALAGTTAQVELTRQARGGPFTDARLVSVSPASAGNGHIVKSADGYRLDFATAATYAGAVQIRFTLSNAYATSAPGIITVNVTARPDPSKDAEVLGILRAQADATRRLAIGQIDNFQRRLESLHGDGNLAGFSNGLSFISGGGRRRNGDFASRSDNLFGDDPQRRYLVQPDGPAQDADAGSAATRQPGSVAFWTGGAVNFGTQQIGSSSNGIDFNTAGITLGADKRLSPAFAIGAGLGYGHDSSDVGHDGSRSTADSYNVATYASYHPTESTYLDGLVGYQWLSFDARRYVTANGNRVQGSRDGKQWFGSLSAGYEHRHDNLLLSPYGRLDVASATLDSYTEHGDALYSLHYDEQKVKTTTGSLGLRMDYPLKRDFGMLSPQLRVEYRHDFQGSSTATMRYADLLSGPLYRASIDGQSRNHTLVGLGLQIQSYRGLMFRVEYQNLFDSSSSNNQSIQLGLEAPFNP